MAVPVAADISPDGVARRGRDQGRLDRGVGRRDGCAGPRLAGARRTGRGPHVQPRRPLAAECRATTARARLWDVATWQQTLVVPATSAERRGSAASPSRRTGRQLRDWRRSDRRARTWDARTGALLATFVGHTDTVQGVAVSAGRTPHRDRRPGRDRPGVGRRPAASRRRSCAAATIASTRSPSRRTAPRWHRPGGTGTSASGMSPPVGSCRCWPATTARICGPRLRPDGTVPDDRRHRRQHPDVGAGAVRGARDLSRSPGLTWSTAPSARTGPGSRPRATTGPR